MNTVIKRISEIEEAASAVMESANTSKKAYAQEMDERIKTFDKELEEETARGIGELKRQMEIEMNRKLELQKSQAHTLLDQIEQNYAANREEYINRLFQTLTEV